MLLVNDVRLDLMVVGFNYCPTNGGREDIFLERKTGAKRRRGKVTRGRIHTFRDENDENLPGTLVICN